ncbi:MAG: TerC/Alx family metal homeostasis membrane protein [Methanomassiliicoccales archaeon]|uniref:TerC/Alx family metal homeostasis membrane protein n=1 Tax=Candidatus Methanarcanum hacksteinii TaxID=2911857 RepID=UPI0015B226C5|nr:TerC/Alx family metal homeostasis membrane protein [Candidatus Methanomethylophilaceae archaeon]MDD7478779.1 TerC/Alx family metal homeostasis membrane protein [Methanomassiliicoccales archaeon]MDY4580937.1 TerC/Alx family metal homeostasis membrane protein [Candidatus Methanarcanum hacksteinii]
MTESIWFWVGFLALVAVLMAFDLGLFNRGSKHIDAKKAIRMTIVWISIAVLFGIFVLFTLGTDKAIEFYTGYIVEESMSIDNLFVFILIFSFFKIPDDYQHKALYYGIFGALIFRAIFIFAGAELMERFDIVIYIFGIILLIAALKTIFKKSGEEEENKMAIWLSKVFKTSPELDGDKFFTRVDGKLIMTPLLLCVIVIELSDVIFALDSIPAVLAISTDTFIVYTSNIFAIMGLRSLYFTIKESMKSLRFLNYGLGIILAFVAFKLLTEKFIEIPVLASLLVIITVLAITVILSLKFKEPATQASDVKE